MGKLTISMAIFQYAILTSPEGITSDDSIPTWRELVFPWFFEELFVAWLNWIVVKQHVWSTDHP